MHGVLVSASAGDIGDASRYIIRHAPYGIRDHYNHYPARPGGVARGL